MARRVPIFLTILAVFAVLAFGCSGYLDEKPETETTVAEEESIAQTAADVLVAPYALSGWPSKNADSANRRFVPVELGSGYTQKWRAFDGDVLLSNPTVGPGGQLYVTRLLREGSANLVALDASGSVLWEAEAYEGKDAPDSCAGISAPSIAEDGTLYLSDCDQLWSYSDDGTVNWVVDLPPAPPRSPFQDDPDIAFNPLTSVTIRPDGSLIGVTVFGQVVSFKPDDGSELAQMYVLPSLIRSAPDESSTSDELWTQARIDRRILEPLSHLLDRTVFPAPLPPAQDADGRLFVVGSAPTGDEMSLYRIEVGESTSHEKVIFMSWSLDVAGLVQSPPSLTSSGEMIVVSDVTGVTQAIDANAGSVVWRHAGPEKIGWSIPTDDNGALVASSSGDVTMLDNMGKQLWSTNATTPFVNSYDAVSGLGDRRLGISGPPTRTSLSVIVNVGFVYEVPTPNGVVDVNAISHVVEIDLANGNIRAANIRTATEGASGMTLSTLNAVMIMAGDCIGSSHHEPALQAVRFAFNFAQVPSDETRCGLEVWGASS